MNRHSRPKVRVGATAPKISDRALATFLDELAAIYRSKETGNAPLANSLYLLAKAVRRRTFQLGEAEKESEKSTKITETKVEKPPKPKPPGADALAKLTPTDVQAFLQDDSKTKNELLDLASARFSIPISQLKRLKAEEVRSTIEAALHHEHSIDILSTESRRGGSARTS